MISITLTLSWSNLWLILFRFQPDSTSSSQHATTTTTLSLPLHGVHDGGQSRDAVQPIIVLQEAPVFFHSSDMSADIRSSLPRRPRGLNPHNPRHQRILRQQNRVFEEDVPPVLLNPETLEDIVIRNGVPLSEAEANK